MITFQSSPRASIDSSVSSRTLATSTSQALLVARHLKSYWTNNWPSCGIPSCPNNNSLIFRIWLPRLFTVCACSRMLSVSTPLSCTEMVGLVGSSPILICPIPDAHFLHFPRTMLPSRPGIGDLIVSWFSAAKRLDVKPRKDSTLGASADSLRVPICESFRLMPPSWFLRFWTDQAYLG